MWSFSLICFKNVSAVFKDYTRFICITIFFVKCKKRWGKDNTGNLSKFKQKTILLENVL